MTRSDDLKKRFEAKRAARGLGSDESEEGVQDFDMGAAVNGRGQLGLPPASPGEVYADSESDTEEEGEWDTEEQPNTPPPVAAVTAVSEPVVDNRETIARKDLKDYNNQFKNINATLKTIWNTYLAGEQIEPTIKNQADSDMAELRELSDRLKEVKPEDHDSELYNRLESNINGTIKDFEEKGIEDILADDTNPMYTDKPYFDTIREKLADKAHKLCMDYGIILRDITYAVDELDADETGNKKLLGQIVKNAQAFAKDLILQYYDKRPFVFGRNWKHMSEVVPAVHDVVVGLQNYDKQNETTYAGDLINRLKTSTFNIKNKNEMNALKAFAKAYSHEYPVTKSTSVEVTPVDRN